MGRISGKAWWFSQQTGSRSIARRRPLNVEDALPSVSVLLYLSIAHFSGKWGRDSEKRCRLWKERRLTALRGGGEGRRPLPGSGHPFEFAMTALRPQPAVAGAAQPVEQAAEIVLGPGRLAPSDQAIGVGGVQGQEDVE